jgi:hypothetical protein
MKKNNVSRMLLVSGASLLLAQAAGAAEIFVNANISTSTTWTADNVYRLVGQIYVLPGATLTIEPGTLIASRPQRRSFARHYPRRPHQRSRHAREPDHLHLDRRRCDVDGAATRRPARGVAVCNEWGNVAVMGRGYISENVDRGEHGGSEREQRGHRWRASPATRVRSDTRVLYGGGQRRRRFAARSQYVCLRYGGKVIGLNNELNGLSLGGVGRGTYDRAPGDHEQHRRRHRDLGWHGEPRSTSRIWNIGDDSLDVDQGWRGKAQFGLIVQGYSALPTSNAQGSGVGDNVHRDRRRRAVRLPASHHGRPLQLHAASANPGAPRVRLERWRPRHRIPRQRPRFRSATPMFMDLRRAPRCRSTTSTATAARATAFNGTLSWANTWTTAFDVYSAVNAPANPAAFYTAQVDGKLNEIKDSVFFNNTFSSAYTEADARGVRTAKNSNVTATASPIAGLTARSNREPDHDAPHQSRDQPRSARRKRRRELRRHRPERRLLSRRRTTAARSARRRTGSATGPPRTPSAPPPHQRSRALSLLLA